jgi:hypothetical protein
VLRSVVTAATGLGEEVAGLDTRSPRVRRAADAAAQLLAVRAERLVPRELLLEFASLDDGLVMVTGEGADQSGEATEVVARRLSRTALLGVAVHALGLAEALS